MQSILPVLQFFVLFCQSCSPNMQSNHAVQSCSPTMQSNHAVQSCRIKREEDRLKREIEERELKEAEELLAKKGKGKKLKEGEKLDKNAIMQVSMLTACIPCHTPAPHAPRTQAMLLPMLILGSLSAGSLHLYKSCAVISAAAEMCVHV